MGFPYVTDIQHDSLHDGHGIRTTVFFKGCPLKCLWCHNPETQRFLPELLIYPGRCTGCQHCLACPQGAVSASGRLLELDRQKCTACGACLDECFYDARELCGKQYSVPELVRLLQKDRAFYEASGGGVTLSGGEVMAQDMDYIEALAQRLHGLGISVYIDTCGQVEFSRFPRLFPYVDAFLYDIKAMDSELHRKLTGADNARILENLMALSQAGKRLWIRIPVIGGANDCTEEISAIGTFLRGVSYEQVHLLPYHNTGSGKYQSLGIPYPGQSFYTPSQARMEQLKALLEGMGISPVYIGG